MIKVCFLLGGFQGNGGIGRVTSILANQLCQGNAYKLYTISYCQTDAPILYTLDDRIENFHMYRSSISMIKALLTERAVSNVKNILKENQIDILIACGALFFPLGILAACGTSSKCYCWEHINPSTTSDYHFQNMARKFGVWYAAKLIVLTKSAKQYYLESLKARPEKVVQIYNPIEVIKNTPYNQESTKIISVGRLCPQKNFGQLINIAAKVLKAHPDWSWDIYGDGEEYTWLNDKIQAENLSEQLVLKGQVFDLYDRYPEYSFLVMTSKYEGFPMTLLEGLSFSLPLLSFDISTGPNEIIENGINGYLIPPFQEEEMAEKITELMEDPKKRTYFSNEAKRKQCLFDRNNILRQWEQIL